MRSLMGACAGPAGAVAVAAGSCSPWPRRHFALRPPAGVGRQRPRLRQCRNGASFFILLGLKLESTAQFPPLLGFRENLAAVSYTDKSQVQEGDIVYFAQGAREKLSTDQAHRFSKLYTKYAFQQTHLSSLATSYLVLLLRVRGDFLLALLAFRLK